MANRFHPKIIALVLQVDPLPHRLITLIQRSNAAIGLPAENPVCPVKSG
jgi:hypothetical protein